MFHWKDGWFFERMSNGAVMITKRKDGGMESPIVTREIIPPEEWASVVASVSLGGENDRRWFKALDFHNGRETNVADDQPRCLCPADGHSELCPIHRVNSSPR